MTLRFISKPTPPVAINEPILWLAFSGNNMLAWDEGLDKIIPSALDFGEFGLEPVRQQYLGTFDGQHCFSVELAGDLTAPAGMVFQNLRQLYERLGETLFALAGRAIQIIAWDRDHQFCSRCGHPTAAMATERAKQCAECGLTTYPRLSPAIIVRVRRGDEMLLARNANWPEGRYSILAGFVEPGETLEETVEREVMEEVGLQVKNIKYFASQSWPFPNSLMLGFTADYDSGDICFNDQEIANAGWFRADNLPQIPQHGSISRVLIDDFLAEYRK